MMIKYSETLYLDGELAILEGVPYKLKIDDEMNNFFIKIETQKLVSVDKFNAVAKLYTSENKLFLKYNFNKNCQKFCILE